MNKPLCLCLAAAAAAFCLAMALSGCTSADSRPPVVMTGSEYSDLLDKTQLLSENTLKKADAGEELSEKEKKDLREAVRIAEGLANYKPNSFANYFLAGKCYFALKDYHNAEVKFRQTIGLLDPKTSVPYLISTRAETFHLHGQCFEALGDFEDAARDAQVAVDMYPNNPNYLAGLASANIQLGSKESLAIAKSALDSALEADPLHARSQALKKLLEAAQTKNPK